MSIDRLTRAEAPGRGLLRCKVFVSSWRDVLTLLSSYIQCMSTLITTTRPLDLTCQHRALSDP